MRTDLEQRIYDRVNAEVIDVDYPSIDAYFAEFRRRMKEYVFAEFQKEFIAKEAFDEAMEEVNAKRRQFSVPVTSRVTPEQVMPQMRRVVAVQPEVPAYQQQAKIDNKDVSQMVASVINDPNSIQWEERKSYRQVKTDMVCPDCGSPLHLKNWPNGRFMLSCNIGAREKECKYGTVLKRAQ